MTTAIKLPELGENVDSGDLTRILVSPGEIITKDQPLLELETEKATIEVPSPVSGVVKELHVQEGRKVKVGDLLLTVEENGAAAKPERQPPREEEPSAQHQPTKEREKPAVVKETSRAAAGAEGAAAQAKKSESEPVRQVQAKKQQEEKEQEETQKPEAPRTATAKAEIQPEKRKPQARQEEPALRPEPRAEVRREPVTGEEAETPADAEEEEKEETVIPFRAETQEAPKRPLAPASPSIRRLARELGIDVNKVPGTGPEGRIDEQDVKNYAREIISRSDGTHVQREGAGELPDFGKWGQIERKPMSNVRRATAEHLTQAWHSVAQVTQFDTADVTDLENLRARFSEPKDSSTPKITVTAIALKIVAAALDKFPQFAASIDMANRQIIYKRYRNIGVAVDTSFGLVVPVVRDVDAKSIPQLAKELTELSEKARAKKLALEEMTGGVFTITNLGGIGGTGFSPIVNYPEVAILGISRLNTEPRHIDGSFEPRKILPISLSYDHRLIDGAEAARFLRWIAEALEQPALLLFKS